MRDPRRRNRNIGTAKSGRGANNRLVIPDRWEDLSPYWQRLSNYTEVEREVFGRTVVFLVEAPRGDHLHHCTVDDVVRILCMLPQEDIEDIKLVVLRQPSVKQEILLPIWGRLGYWSVIGRHEGPGIYLDAQPKSLILKWGRSLRPDDQEEFDRLENAGFRIERHSRGFRFISTPQAIRALQLYVTLPHEVGHYVDYLESTMRSGLGEELYRLEDLYETKPSREKEAFANRYSDEFRQDMRHKGLIPFDPTYDVEGMRADGLPPEWFAVPGAAV